MKATVKCSNCGAEITNLNFSWGRKQWLWFLPLLIIYPLSMWMLLGPKGDFRKDLQITILERRESDKSVEILGSIENKGKTKWDNVAIDCCFFDAQGAFIDKASGGVEAVVMPNESEYFKITAKDTDGKLNAPGIRMDAKIADALSDSL
jgi:hypothetical protein